MSERTRFLIFARPRSRSAWLANALTYGSSFCLHEPLADAGSLPALVRDLDALPAPVVGCADTGLIHVAEEALAILPDARLVVLVSDGRAWSLFAREHRLPRRLVELVDRAYLRALELLHGRALFVEADELDRAPVVRRLFEHVGAGTSFSSTRHRMLVGLRVQVDPDRLLARIRGTLSS